MTDKPVYSQAFDRKADLPLAERIEALWDREEIRELVARYAHRIANGLGVQDLFTEDATFTQRSPGAPVQHVEGAEQLDVYYKALEGVAAARLPMIHNTLVQLDGDTATGISSLQVRLSRAPGPPVLGTAYYDDRFRKVAGAWKFATRDIHILCFDQI